MAGDSISDHSLDGITVFSVENYLNFRAENYKQKRIADNISDFYFPQMLPQMHEHIFSHER